MLIRDMFLAVLTSVIWGVGFVVAKVGLESFSASQMTALRFLMVSVFVVMVPRPKLPWPSLIMIGATVFTGQFLLLFFAFTHGMPPGLASVSQQTQAFFTVLLSAAFLRDMPDARQLIGMVIAFAGLALIAMTVGSDLNLVGLGLAVAGAFSWAVGSALSGCRCGALRSAHAMHGRRGIEAHLRRSFQSSTLCRHGTHPVRTGHHRPAAAAQS